VISVLFIETGMTVCTSTIAFYSKYVMRFDLGVTVIMGTLFVSSMVFAPLIGALCRKLGAKNTYILTIGIFAAGAFGFFLAPSIIFAVIAAAASGMGVSGVMIMPNMLYAEVIDDDQVRTGVRREGSFYGMNALVMRLSIVFQGLVTAFVWERSGYIEGAASQSASAVQGIRALMGLTPLAFAVIAVTVLLFYPINKERLAEVQEKVRSMNRETSESENR
jgi:GPH family glycoside/pentoside/hexuronide:cation symporter